MALKPWVVENPSAEDFLRRDAFVNLHRDIFGTDFVVYGPEQDLRIWSLESGEASLLGFGILACTHTPTGQEWYLVRIGVSPCSRHAGLGNMLMGRIESTANFEKVKAFHLRTYRRWDAMRILLAKRGWLFVDTRPGRHQDGVSERWIFPLNIPPVRTVLVGANPQGRGGELFQIAKNLKNPTGTPFFDFCGIVDQNLHHCEAPMYAGLPTGSALEPLLEMVSPEAVILCLPHHAYRDIRSRCIRNGLAVFQEKPLAISPIEVQELQNLLHEHPVPFCVGVQRRNHPTYVYLKNNLIRDEVECVSLEMCLGLDLHRILADSSWRGAVETAGGGVLVDLGYHALDLVHFLLDSPVQLVSHTLWHGEKRTGGNPPETRADLLGRCGNIWVRIHLNRCGGSKREELHIRTRDTDWIAGREEVKKNGTTIFTAEGAWDKGLRGRIAAFALGARLQPPPVDLWDHYSILHLVQGVYGRSDPLAFKGNSR